jgi:hypothetical protein
MTTVSPGRYRHYKGNEYTVLGVAQHSETKEELVVYRQKYGEQGLWVRPKQKFLETVNVDGQDVPRFQHLGSETEASRENIKSLFDDVPQHLPEELVQTLLRVANVRIERIISHGHASPEGFWYEQGQHEWGCRAEGRCQTPLRGWHRRAKAGRFREYPGAPGAPGGLDDTGRADDLAGSALWRSAVAPAERT